MEDLTRVVQTHGCVATSHRQTPAKNKIIVRLTRRPTPELVRSQRRHVVPLTVVSHVPTPKYATFATVPSFIIPHCRNARQMTAQSDVTPSRIAKNAPIKAFATLARLVLLGNILRV